MQQAEHAVNVGRSQDHAHDGARTFAAAAARDEVAIGFKLQAQVGRSVEQEPVFSSRDGELSLRAGAAAKLFLANASAVGAGAIPLREPAPGGRAEDLNAH